MRLNSTDQEFVHFDIDGLPDGAAPVVSFDSGVTWTQLEDAADGWRILVRGPDAAATEGHLVARSCAVLVRLVDNPEVLTRRAGTITLY